MGVVGRKPTLLPIFWASRDGPNRLNSHIQGGQFHRLTIAHIRHRIRHHLEKLVPRELCGAQHRLRLACKPIPIIRADPDKNPSGLAGHVGRRGQGGGGATAQVQKVDGDGTGRKGRSRVAEMTVSGVEIDLTAVRLQEL